MPMPFPIAVGSKHHRWKGGRYRTRFGYIHIRYPGHPRAEHHGYVAEHRLTMEAHIGRYLEPYEVVHHINGIRDDNRIENLKLFPNHSEHIKYELSTGARKKIREYVVDKENSQSASHSP